MLINNILETNRIKRRLSTKNVNSEVNLLKNLSPKKDPTSKKPQPEVKENKNINLNINNKINSVNIKTNNTSISEIFETLQNVEEEIEVGQSTLKQKIEYITNNTILHKIIDLISVFFAISIFIIYIIQTYLPQSNFKWFNIYNYIVATFFNLETILYIYIAHHRFRYFLHLMTLIFLFTSIMPYFAFINNRYIIMLVEVARICHIFRISIFISSNIKINENDVVKHVVSMVQKFVVIILFISLLIRVVELDKLNYFLISPETRVINLSYQNSFHDFLYFTVVTISTVGYGDIYPVSEEGRFVIICLIIFAAFLIPKETGELLTLLENTSIYSREIYNSNSDITHIVICGNLSVDGLKSFCEELFHIDHGKGEKNVVIIDPKMPSQEMKLFLHTGKFEVNLRYLQGDPMLDKDLDRADIVNAKTTVILTDKYTTKPNSIDHKNILLALSIKKYFLKKQKYDSTLLIQLIKPENKIHYITCLESLTIGNQITNDRMIILEEIKMNLLSKSCLIPGIIPLIANLVRSSGYSEETEYSWLNEYLDGAGMEIYRARLNESFKNQSFVQISKYIYKEYDAIAFALEIEIDGKTLITLNPGSFFIEKFFEERNDVNFFIYVICCDKEVADHISKADILNQLNEDEDISKKEQFTSIKKETKFQSYMHLKLTDILRLDENYLYTIESYDEEDNYFFTQNKMGISPDVKKDSIRNSLIYRDHIVVCGIHPSLYYYLLPLRAKYFGKENLKYVVILTQDMPKELWESICKFENIILINGSPLNVEDLYRANIEYASKAVILENESINKCEFNNKMIDAERIFIYKAIKKCNANIQIMTELVFESNIEYMLPQEELNHMYNPTKISYERMSVFSSGEVYISSILDSLIAQAYYNKHIVTIIHQLLTGNNNKTSNGTIRIMCENVGLRSSNFWQMNVPEKFINKTFGELFDEFCDNNLIALGLYRLPGARDNETAYVYTKPNRECRITHRDKIFVLAIEHIKNYFQDEENNSNNDSVFEKIGKKNFSQIIKEEIKGKNNPHNNNNNFFEDNNNNFSPFSYVNEIVTDIEKEVENLENLINNTKNSIRESIASGIKQEIISLLH